MRLLRSGQTVPWAKEIEAAYGALPLLTLRDLQFADVINLTASPSGWWPPAAAGTRILDGSIIDYQDREYPGRPGNFIYSTHTVINADPGRLFHVTSPYATWATWTNFAGEIDPARWLIVTRYQHRTGDEMTAEEREIFMQVFRDLDGTRYDYGQLLAILINQIAGWPRVLYLPIFDLSRNRKVCSVAARIAWLRWWKEYGKSNVPGARRPGGSLIAERTPPAHFEIHETHRIAGRLILAA
jgi:hypothetical protein